MDTANGPVQASPKDWFRVAAETRLAPAALIMAMTGLALLTANQPLGAEAMLASGLFWGWRPRPGTSQPADAPSSSLDAPASAEAPVEIAEVVQALDLPAVALDEQRQVVAFNRHAADLFPAIAIGKPVTLVSRHPDLMQSIDRVFERGSSEITEISERLPQGRNFLVTASPLPSAAMLLLQFRDTSEQERLAKLRADFIANASHELRTPLASIKGFIETLQGSARDDAAARTRFLAIMESQAARMNRILDDLLSLSRIEMRAHLRPDGIVDIADVAGHVVRGLEPLARQAGIRLQYVPPAGPVPIRGDRDEIEQVLQNLVHNAIKYGHQNGSVEIAVTRRPATRGARATVAVSVTDDGPGIAPEHLPRLTERFYRVDTARSRERGGTGLGLAIVKHILNRHQGELEIVSEVGRGAQFTVVLESLPE